MKPPEPDLAASFRDLHEQITSIDPTRERIVEWLGELTRLCKQMAERLPAPKSQKRGK